jgi:hypothetical protein
VLLVGPPQAVHSAWWPACFSSLLKASEKSRPPASTVRFQHQEVLVPIGIEPEKFQVWLERLARVKPTSTAVVVYGSRTHFSYGYLPDSASDLGVQVFFQGVPITQRPVEVYADALQSLSPVRVSIVFPVTDFKQSLSERAFQFPATKEEDRLHFEATARKPILWLPFRHWDVRRAHRDRLYRYNPFIGAKERRLFAENAFNLFVMPPSVVSFSKEALIFLQQSDPESDAHQLALEKAGFTNIYQLTLQD